MAYRFGNLPPYVLNRKRVKRTEGGKYKYRYPLNDSAVTATVPEECYLVMAEFDRLEYNNDRKEIRHRGEVPAYHDDSEHEETNALENLGNEHTYWVQDEICERLDREVVLAKLSELDRRIYNICIEKDYIQEKAAEILGINQSTVGRRLAIICDLVESEKLNDGTRTKEEIRFELLWQELLRTGKNKQDDDIFLEHILACFHHDDMWLFLNWFYSFKEMNRYILKYFILREHYFQQDIDDFLKTAPEAAKNHFNEHYIKHTPLVQCVYVNMFTEAMRRMKNSREAPLGTAYYAFDEQLEKVSKRQGITENEFFRNRFFPFLASKRLKRQEEFLKRYKH